CSLSRNRPASTRASRTVPLPFCRGTISPTCCAAQLPSRRSPIESSRTFSCHSSRIRPALAARSIASWPALLTASRTLLYVGVCTLTTSALCVFINGVTLLARVDGCQFPQLCELLDKLAGDDRDIPRGGDHHPARQLER